MSMCKTVSQEQEEEHVKTPITIIKHICENEEVQLIKRYKGQKENHKLKIKNPVNRNEKDERKGSMRTMIDDVGPSFSINMNMLYPKNILTYSAYVKNMEGFIKNTLELKKDIKLHHYDTFRQNNAPDNTKPYKDKNKKVSETLSASNKQLNSGLGKSLKSTHESTINEENHPSLRRRYARLFISVPK